MKNPPVFKVQVSEEVFMEYYNKYKPLVYHVIAEYNLEKNLAEDIALHMFAKIPELAKKYDQSKGSFPYFIIVCTKNLIINAITRIDYYDKHKVFIDTDLVDPKTLPTPHGFKISYLKGYLTEAEYDMIVHIYIYEYTLKAYASMINTCYATVKKRHKVLLQKIRKIL